MSAAAAMMKEVLAAGGNIGCSRQSAINPVLAESLRNAKVR